MADKSVITNIEARVRQLIDDHKRLSDLCAELTAQRDTLRSEKRTLEERGMRAAVLDAVTVAYEKNVELKKASD